MLQYFIYLTLLLKMIIPCHFIFYSWKFQHECTYVPRYKSFRFRVNYSSNIPWFRTIYVDLLVSCDSWIIYCISKYSVHYLVVIKLIRRMIKWRNKKTFFDNLVSLDLKILTFGRIVPNEALNQLSHLEEGS